MAEPVGPIALRPGTKADVDQVFQWANDPVTREVSFNTAPIPREAHVAWYTRQLATDGRNLFIAEEDGAPVGVVRLDRTDGVRRCVISITIAPDARGRGVGTAALTAAASVAETLGFTIIEAYVRPSNQASIRAFMRAGYRDAGAAEAVLGENSHLFELDLSLVSGAAP